MDNQNKPTMEQALLTMQFQSHMRGMTNHLMKTENLTEEVANKKAWEILQPQYKEQLKPLHEDFNKKQL